MNLNPIAEFIDRLIVDRPLSFRNLTIFPILTKVTEEEKEYMLLREAISYRCVSIYETGKMEEVKISNNSNDEVLIMTGETLLGGGQNRTINLPLNIKPNTTSCVSSSCVEINRWEVPANFSEETAATFGDADISPLPLRKLTTENILLNYLNENTIKVRQEKVWSFIAEYLRRGKVKSHTLDIHDIYKEYKGEVEDFCDGVLIQRNQIGCIAAINNRFCCIELFSDKNIFRKLYSLLLKSYGIDAILNPVENFICKLDMNKAQNFIKRIKTSRITNYKFSDDGNILFIHFNQRMSFGRGNGMDSRFRGNDIKGNQLSGISLVSNGKIISLSCFLSEN